MSAGDTLIVRVQAPPCARLTIALEVTTTHTVMTGSAKHRKKVTRTVVLYRVASQGVADTHGRFTARLHVTYQPKRDVTARLLVSARTARGALSRTLSVKILQPLPPCPVPCTIPVGSHPLAVAVDSQSGHVFVANSADDTVTMLDAATGRVLDTVDVGGAPGALAVDSLTGRIFVANAQTDSVSVLDSRTATLRATVRVGGTPWTLAAAPRIGHVFVVSANRVLMLDAHSGAILRRLVLGSDPADLAVDDATSRVFVADQVTLRVSVLDARTGALRGSASLGEIPWALAAAGQSGLVLVTHGTNHASLLDALTGALQQTVSVGQAPQAVALDARTGRAFVANTAAGTVSVLDLGSGALLRTVRVGRQPRAIAVDVATGRVFVANRGAGTVSVLDARTGLPRRTSRVGPQPVALAVDEQRGRVFVVVSNGPGSHGTLTVLDAR